MERHTTFFLSNITTLEFCGTHIGFQATASAFEIPFEVIATEGEHNYKKCKSCQTTYKKLLNVFTKKYYGKSAKGLPFPHCCSSHLNLSKKSFFNKNDFDSLNLPKLVTDKIIFTKQHILNNHNKPDWFEDITDYIDYVVLSFGQTPSDCGEPVYLSNYLDYLSQLIKNLNLLPEGKKSRIIDFVKTIQSPIIKKKTDTNVLLKTYQDWYQTFPFELSFFANLKTQFYPTLPKISYAEPLKVNRYSGHSTVKTHTKDTLIRALINLTNDLLTQINGLTLHEKGLITDANNFKLELVINKRRLKLKQGYANNSTDADIHYRKILKQWFKDECRFIDEITPILNVTNQLPSASIESVKVETKAEKLKSELSKYGFFGLAKVKQLSEPNQFALIDFLSLNAMPYGIAMLDELGFCEYLDNEQGAKYKANKILSKLFNPNAKDDTSAKHYRRSLIKPLPRYKAGDYKEIVKKDYQKLK